MSKKILIALLVLVIIATGIWVILTVSKGKPLKVLGPGEKPTPAEKAELNVGVGWSVKDDEVEAVTEAVNKVKTGLGEVAPEFAILFPTVGYDVERLVSETKAALGPQVKLLGVTSCLGVMTNEGYHVGKKGSLALLALSSPEMDFGIAGISLEGISPEEAGRRALEEAMKDADREGITPDFIWISASPGQEEGILRGIADLVGPEVPVSGGSAADNTITGNWKVSCNEKIYSNGLVVVAIYSKVKIGHGYQSGFLVQKQHGKVTKAKGRIIYEINGRSASEVYNEWVGGLFTEEQTKKGASVLAKATFWPLGKSVKGAGGNEYYIAVHPLSFNPDGSMTVFAEMHTGESISLLHGTWEILLNRVLATATMARSSANITKKEVGVGIVYFCAGSLLAIPEEERPNLPALINEALGGAPFIGIFGFGEQGTFPGAGGNYHGNLMSGQIVIGNTLK